MPANEAQDRSTPWQGRSYRIRLPQRFGAAPRHVTDAEGRLLAVAQSERAWPGALLGRATDLGVFLVVCAIGITALGPWAEAMGVPVRAAALALVVLLAVALGLAARLALGAKGPFTLHRDESPAESRRPFLVGLAEHGPVSLTTRVGIHGNAGRPLGRVEVRRFAGWTRTRGRIVSPEGAVLAELREEASWKSLVALLTPRLARLLRRRLTLVAADGSGRLGHLAFAGFPGRGLALELEPGSEDTLDRRLALSAALIVDGLGR